MLFLPANKLSDEELIPQVGEFRLMDRRIISELKKINDYNPNVRGVIANIGFKQIGIPYTRKKRERCKTSANILVYFETAINGIISHSIILLRASTFAD